MLLFTLDSVWFLVFDAEMLWDSVSLRNLFDDFNNLAKGSRRGYVKNAVKLMSL